MYYEIFKSQLELQRLPCGVYNLIGSMLRAPEVLLDEGLFFERDFSRLITFNNNYTIYTIYIHDYMIFM